MCVPHNIHKSQDYFLLDFKYVLIAIALSSSIVVCLALERISNFSLIGQMGLTVSDFIMIEYII